MLLATRPGHAQSCRRARYGCTCFYFPGDRGRRAAKLRRRAARAAAAAAWRRDLDQG
ncbi:MAG TPA: hypothetical protein VLH10_15135 [Yinghuangia sp.]|nr:hypothetical protein [Yinghuangia sp.]